MTAAPDALTRAHPMGASEPEKARYPEAVLATMDRCTKCGICQAHCPVAAATEAFPGPKYTGPQAQRFRIIEPVQETAPNLCSGCGICSSVCPNDVAITDIIALAKADLVERGDRLAWRQRLLNRPDIVGGLASYAPSFVNFLLASPLLRYLAERSLGIHRAAPLPRAQKPLFRQWLARQSQPEGPSIAYFTGCAVEHFDPFVGIAAVHVLNRLGLRVSAPSKACCSLPMLSSGEWAAARPRVRELIADLTEVSAAGQAIIATSTSCSLTLREKYAAYLAMSEGPAAKVAERISDVCEFLRDGYAVALQKHLRPLSLRVLYHGPCQLRGHRMGQPAFELLGLVPGLQVERSTASCCGVAGTYGYDWHRYPVAMAVGKTLFDQIEDCRPDLVACDSETCRWHIEKATGVPSRHPVEVLAASTLDSDPRQRGTEHKG